MVGVAIAAVEGADAGNTDGEDGDGGLDGGPDRNVNNVVCWAGKLVNGEAWIGLLIGVRLTSEVGLLGSISHFQESDEADDIEDKSDDTECEHGDGSRLQSLVELEPQDLSNWDDDDQEIGDDVRDLQAVVEWDNWDASLF